MTEMIRIRIVPYGEYFRFERKVRNEWVLELAENGEPLTATSREVAERKLKELAKN